MHNLKVCLSTDSLRIYALYFVIFLYAAKNFYPQKLLVHLFILENHFLPMFGQKGRKSSFFKEILFFTNGDQECS